ncbi:MAG: MFS transporter [Solirubrobacteraceae bacterium]|nr:MFS transporter [Solirubrobacteraceae bacterium]
MTRRTKVAALVSTGVFMASLDLFIVNIAFTDIQRDFEGSTLGGLSWVLSAYAIVFAAALVPAGRWFDRVGRKRGFLAGVSLFGVASAICAVAPGVEVLVAARILQALGAAMLMPTSLGLLLPEFPPEKRAGAVALWAAVGGVAAAAGPPLGGLLVELSWRWVFIVNVPIALAAVLIGRTLLNEIRDPEPGPRPDLVGAALLVVAIALLTWGVVEAPDHGWGGLRTVGGLLGSVIALVAFAARSRTHAAPVVPPEIVARPAFSWSTATSLLFYVAFGSMLLNGVLLLTQLWDYSTLLAGLALAPGPAVAAATASRGGGLVTRFGARPVMMAGALAFATGALYGHFAVEATPNYLTAFLPANLIGGFGVGLILPSTANAAFGALPPTLLSTGIAVFTVARQVGSALGVAILVAVYASPANATELANAVQGGYLMMAISAGLALLLATQVRVAAAGAGPAGDGGRGDDASSDAQRSRADRDELDEAFAEEAMRLPMPIPHVADPPTAARNAGQATDANPSTNGRVSA